MTELSCGGRWVPGQGSRAFCWLCRPLTRCVWGPRHTETPQSRSNTQRARSTSYRATLTHAARAHHRTQSFNHTHWEHERVTDGQQDFRQVTHTHTHTHTDTYRAARDLRGTPLRRGPPQWRGWCVRAWMCTRVRVTTTKICFNCLQRLLLSSSNNLHIEETWLDGSNWCVIKLLILRDNGRVPIYKYQRFFWKLNI